MKHLIILILLVISTNSFSKDMKTTDKRYRKIASTCGGITSFIEAKEVKCIVKNFNTDSEDTILKKMKSSEGGVSSIIFTTPKFEVEADSYSIGACNEGDFIFVINKKSQDTSSTKNGEISFRSKDGADNYSIKCEFVR